MTRDAIRARFSPLEPALRRTPKLLREFYESAPSESYSCAVSVAWYTKRAREMTSENASNFLHLSRSFSFAALKRERERRLLLREHKERNLCVSPEREVHDRVSKRVQSLSGEEEKEAKERSPSKRVKRWLILKAKSSWKRSPSRSFLRLPRSVLCSGTCCKTTT